MKKKRRWPDQLDESDRADAVVQPPEPDIDPRALLLPELLSQLSPASRTVILLHYFEDLTLAEISDVLDISVGTVKSRLAYGLAQLRRQMPETQVTDG